ncbi:leukocidin subunit S [Pseudoalteromonas piscicida]|uniref:leukocidin subunit S n=1 Tax=Pseudoalteromonas piscicida TaxID=43662 RepID=UPI001CB7B6DF|nr:leukocidin subunit S [Pseudoalteromonas piscicida]
MSDDSACIVSRQTQESYCLKAGESSGYSLPSYIYNHEVDVIAPPGLGVMLSDWDNLSYNRIATFTGYTNNAQLKQVTAKNGQKLDFSHPRSMRVVSTQSQPQACIRSLDTGDKFCLEAGQRSGYSLPSYINKHAVEVIAPPGLGVVLSDWDNLSYNRIATFTGYKSNSQLINVQARNGEALNFSTPRSMSVVRVDSLKQACIKSLKTGEFYCLQAGETSGYSLPSYIYEQEVEVIAPEGLGVVLSDWDNLSYNRIATFTGNVSNKMLEANLANNGEYLDFSSPRSMKVISIAPKVEFTSIESVTSTYVPYSNEFVFKVNFMEDSVGTEKLNIQFQHELKNAKEQYTSIVYISFDGGATWPTVVDVSDLADITIPKGAQSVWIKGLSLPNAQQGAKLTLQAWLSSAVTDSFEASLDLNGFITSNSSRVSRIKTISRNKQGQRNDTGKKCIIKKIFKLENVPGYCTQADEGDIVTSKVFFDNPTTSQTHLFVQFVNGTAKKDTDIRSIKVTVSYKGYSEKYTLKVNLKDFKVLNLPEGVEHVRLSYRVYKDNLSEDAEYLSFKAWTVNDDVNYSQITISEN